MLERSLKIGQMLIIMFSICYMIVSLFHSQAIVAPTFDHYQLQPNFFQLGVLHIVLGFDHLIFLLLLMLLFGRQKIKLLKAITAFTIGHSMALTLAVYGYLSIPSQPVEMAIMMSLVILAIELRHKHKSFIYNYSFIATGVFGLIHGLGLADGLVPFHIEQTMRLSALVHFNLGIECGQLLFIAVASVLMLLLTYLFNDKVKLFT